MKKLGRNQLIIVITGGVTLMGSWLAAKFMTVEQATMWLDFAQIFVPILVGLITVPSAAIKMKNGNPKPPA